jgi:hypothetical protein
VAVLLGEAVYPKPHAPQAPPLAQVAKPASAPAAPRVDDLTDLAEYNRWDAAKRLEFILAMLDKRDAALSNMKYSVDRRVVNVVPSTGNITFVRATEYEFRRKGNHFWQSTVAHPGGKDDPNEIASKTIQTWDGTRLQGMGFPPYDGEEYHVVHIEARESSTFSDLKTNGLLGFRGVGPTAGFSAGNLARWIEWEQRAKVAIDTPPIEVNGDQLLTVKIAIGPTMSQLIYLDPSHDFAVSRLSTFLYSKNVVSTEMTLETTAWERINGIWLPTRAVEHIVSSSRPDFRQEVTYALHGLAVGTVTDDAVAFTYPMGTHVLDLIRKIDYILKPDGTFDLDTFADQEGGFVYVPTT